MADVYVNALTTISTEPTTTDSLVAVNRNTNEGKIIDYNLLADVILNKIASKQFSGLTTTSKLLTGAINELDSDVSSLNSSLHVGNTVTVIDSNFTSGTAKVVTIPSDGFYFAIAQNESTGANSIFLYTDTSLSTFISASPTVSAEWVRQSTPIIPFKAGTTVVVRGFFTLSLKFCKIS